VNKFAYNFFGSFEKYQLKGIHQFSNIN